MSDVPQVGGKSASLGEMTSRLAKPDVDRDSSVPAGSFDERDPAPVHRRREFSPVTAQ